MAKQRFEGWYCKQQTRAGDTLALIVGRAKDEAFLQVVTDERAWNVPFPRDAYQRANPAWLGKNRFSTAGVYLDVHTGEITLRGTLFYGEPTPLRYDIMGPLAPLPLECRHSVRSMRHSVRGTLRLNGALWDFTGGLGYMEGDSGTSFPQSYTWAQCNAFPFPASVLITAARIPVGPFAPWGCTAVVLLGQKQYRIASYLGATIEQRTRSRLVLRQGRLRLCVDVPDYTGHALRAPQSAGMVRTIHESPACPARFRLWRGKVLLLDAESPFASYEYVE